VFIQIGESDMKKKEEPRVAQRNFVAKYALENGGGWHRDRKKEYRRQPLLNVLECFGHCRVLRVQEKETNGTRKT
jgi:hypothetical protein